MALAAENRGFLSRFLARQLSAGRIRRWKIFFFALLAAAALLNLAIINHHPHFGWDRYTFFWPAFGLIAGLLLVASVKKILQPLIKKPEDYYGDL
ncbi:MAG: hypothetical protein LBK52_00085 [Deltaproteobacteria bacterium]|jgi:hypothetical protein|nr:hypothetical protein [Deltaproteobacteria bacterium]